MAIFDERSIKRSDSGKPIIEGKPNQLNLYWAAPGIDL